MAKIMFDAAIKSVNAFSTGIVMAQKIFKNIYQGNIESEGKGSTEQYSQDTQTAQIRIVHPLPLDMSPRQLGATLNGGSYSEYSFAPQSDEFLINILDILDSVVNIPRVTGDMVPVDVMSPYLQNIADNVILYTNAIKIAGRLLTAYTTKQAGGAIYETSYNSSADKFVDKCGEAIFNLDDGAPENGVHVWDRETEVCIIKSATQKYLTSVAGGGVLSIGGSNYAQDILKGGALDAQSTPTRSSNGFIGNIHGVDFHFASETVWTKAESYLGFPAKTFDKLYGLVAAAGGNFFAMAHGNSIIAQPTLGFQGVQLQPLYRFGFANPIAKANAYVVDSTFVNPYGLASIFSTGVVWQCIGKGSRPVHSISLASSASQKLTATCATATQAAVVVGTAEITNIGAWLTAYAAATTDATKAVLTLGTEATLTGFTSGKVATVLVIDAIGTVALKAITRS